MSRVDLGLILLLLHTSRVLVVCELTSAACGGGLVGLVVLAVACCHHGGLWPVCVGLALLCNMLEGCLLVCSVL